MGIIDVKKLIEGAKDIKAPRYKTINKQKIKLEDFNSLDEFEKEELELNKPNEFKELDDELNALNKQWELENNPLRKQFLLLKYDLRNQSYFGDDPQKVSLIMNQILKLEREIKKIELEQKRKEKRKKKK